MVEFSTSVLMRTIWTSIKDSLNLEDNVDLVSAINNNDKTTLNTENMILGSSTSAAHVLTNDGDNDAAATHTDNVPYGQTDTSHHPWWY